MSELIPLEEAISDYQQAREDYIKKVEEAKNFFKIDRQVFESILRIHFKATEVYVFDNEVKLIYLGDEQDRGFYDNIPEEAEEFLKNRKYLHKYIESNKDTSKMEITFKI